jgi:hypothetical protein
MFDKKKNGNKTNDYNKKNPTEIRSAKPTTTRKIKPFSKDF